MLPRDLLSNAALCFIHFPDTSSINVHAGIIKTVTPTYILKLGIRNNGLNCPGIVNNDEGGNDRRPRDRLQRNIPILPPSISWSVGKIERTEGWKNTRRGIRRFFISKVHSWPRSNVNWPLCKCRRILISEQTGRKRGPFNSLLQAFRQRSCSLWVFLCRRGWPTPLVCKDKEHCRAI